MDKFQEYESGGVDEYLLVDPERRQVELYRLIQGRHAEVQSDNAGVLRFESVAGFWLKTDWLNQRPLPSSAEVLRSLGVS